MPKPAILDPAGVATGLAMEHLGLKGVSVPSVLANRSKLRPTGRMKSSSMKSPTIYSPIPWWRITSSRFSPRAMPTIIRCAVIQFPGSNCDTDCKAALASFPEIEAEIVWHKDTSLEGYDLIVLPGGFSYGDYLRCGSIARFSPIMGAVRHAASTGVLVLGICNGFQILCEAGLLPGTLMRNRGLLFRCEHQHLRVENNQTPFTSNLTLGSVVNFPIAHGEGSYFADPKTLAELNANNQIILLYADAAGTVSDSVNPNGSLENIAGICSHGRNVFGLMPHPERACDALLGGTDGRAIFQSVIDTFSQGKRA